MTTISNQLSIRLTYTACTFKGQYFPFYIHVLNYMKVLLLVRYFLQAFYATIPTVTSTSIVRHFASRLMYRAKKAHHEYTVHTHIAIPHIRSQTLTDIDLLFFVDHGHDWSYLLLCTLEQWISGVIKSFEL